MRPRVDNMDRCTIERQRGKEREREMCIYLSIYLSIYIYIHRITQIEVDKIKKIRTDKTR